MPGMKAMLKKIKSRMRNPDSNEPGGAKPEKKLPENVDYTGPFTKEDLLQATPGFRDVAVEHRRALLIKKLRLCSITFDFNDESSRENLGKEMKRQLLLEIVDHITTTKHWFDELVLVEIYAFVASNLFRALPPSANASFDPDEDDPTLDPAWPHLQIVYEFLLRFVVSSYTDPKLMKKHIDKKFILALIGLFKSEDPRERDYLKTILHRIYGKFMSFRSFIRRSINNVFYDFIYRTEQHNGVSELLEILGSIINGFAMPLKQEHKDFLRNVLIPLHKVKVLSQFHQQLAYCVTQFIDKDQSLGTIVIGGLLKFWPQISSSKELLFINELEEVIEITPADELLTITQPLFGQVAKSICSLHFQVAERTLFLWNNEIISTFTSENRKEVLPILYPALHKNSKNHWNSTVHSLTFNIIRMFMDMDAQLFERVSGQFDEEYQDEDSKTSAREERWRVLRMMAARSA